MIDTVLVNGVEVDANDYQAQAGNYAAASGVLPDEAAANAEAVAARADHAAAARYYWAAAYAAKERRDWAAMRAQAEQADKAASPDGVLLAAIFGGCARPAEERAVAQGRNLPADLVAQARKAVRAEIAAHAATVKAGRQAQRDHERAVARARTEALDRARAGALPAVGQIVTVRLPYRLAKATREIAIVDLNDGAIAYIQCADVDDGARVRVTAHVHARSFGRVIELRGELA